LDEGEIGRTLSADPGRWSATVRANLDGTFHAIRAFHLLFRARAKIICFSGGGGTKPRANFSAYGSAKTAMEDRHGLVSKAATFLTFATVRDQTLSL